MIREQINQILGSEGAGVARTENEKFGDYFSSAALKSAKASGKNPLEEAQRMKAEIETKNPSLFSKIEIAGAGFLNFFLSEDILQKELKNILEQGEKYGETDFGKGKKVQVEFISANPTGPLTLGNGRGGFFGDALANILKKAGYETQKGYFVNDAGYQVEVLGHSVLGDSQAQYKGDYIKILRRKFTGWFSSKDPKIVGQKSAEYILEKLIKPTIEKKMKIKFDSFVSEKEIKASGAPEKILEMLKEKKLIYEQDGATWFKSTQLGDDKDRVLITSKKEDRESAATYLLPDAAYHYKKFKEDKFDLVVDVWGADHHGYISRLQAAGKALDAWDESKLKIVIMQMVRLIKNGQEVKMSKRSGNFVTLDELLEEIPLDAARWFFLARSPETHMDFDMDLAREQSPKNPVYYAQYAYARLSSILRKTNIKNYSLSGVEGLNHPSELSLIKQLIRLPEIVEDTARDFGVQRLPQYALDLVRSFHKFYEDCRVFPILSEVEGDENNKDLTSARLALCEATRVVLKNTFDLMGISAPEKM